MAQLTKSQLVSQLAASHEAYQRLLVVNEELRAKLIAPPKRAFGERKVTPAAQRAPSAFQLRCQAAREQAMSTGQSVLL